MGRPFLTARWHNLFNATYRVPATMLEKRVPPGVELEVRDGSSFVSLVAFEFLDTRVFGIGWPGYRNFAELNLRFYVRHGQERGVVFIREFVPQRLVAWMARWLYNEPYLSAPISAQRQESADDITLDYRLTFGGRQHTIQVTGSKPGYCPGEETTEHFFKEHHWGFGVTRSGKALRYQVDHPVWSIYPVKQYQLDFDFGVVYGPEWAFLAGMAPLSVLFAAGSDVAVWPLGKLK